MQFKIYKRGQGYYTRLYSGLVLFMVVAIGCYQLYQKLKVWDNPWVWALIPAGVCAAFAAIAFWILNRPSIADFLIAAEGELKKVSWSSRKEVATSTLIVISVVIFMSLMLLVADFGFQYVFQKVGLYGQG